MMGVSLYEGISKREINATRITSEGKTYSINHPSELLVNMRFKGKRGFNVNSQGWERSSSYYFKELRSQHPEFFSKKNNMLIKFGKSPVVDKKFVDYFPQYREYKGEILVHHHIGRDGQAVALPQSIHKGYGEIHTIEHNLGITDKAQDFSKSCGEACKMNPSLYGKTSDRFKSAQNNRKKTNNYDNGVASEDRAIVNNNSIKGATHSAQVTEGSQQVINSYGKCTNQSRG